jgi:hypothetical protein
LNRIWSVAQARKIFFKKFSFSIYSVCGSTNAQCLHLEGKGGLLGINNLLGTSDEAVTDGLELVDEVTGLGADAGLGGGGGLGGDHFEFFL